MACQSHSPVGQPVVNVLLAQKSPQAPQGFPAPTRVAGPPAVWYPSPEGTGHQYWDGVAWTGECCDGTLDLTDFVDPTPLLGACAISVDVGVRLLSNRLGSLGGARCRLEARLAHSQAADHAYHSISADPAAHLNRCVHGSKCVEVAGECSAHKDAGDTPRTSPGLGTLLSERRRQRSGGTIRRSIRLGCFARYILCVRKGT